MSSNDLIQVFRDTLDVGRREYSQEIQNMLDKTWVIKGRSVKPATVEGAKVSFELGTSSSKVFKYANQGHCAVLNFADGLDKGGLVWRGASTQEESLCRVSTLYYALDKPECSMDYYEYNHPYGYLCSDRFIYSQDVLFFKDDDFNRVAPVKCDVITSPAPVVSTCTNDEYIERVLERMVMYLGYARRKGVEIIILGAWGCGAFGGDSVVMGRCFKSALMYIGGFKRIVFTATELATVQRLQSGFRMGAYPIK